MSRDLLPSSRVEQGESAYPLYRDGFDAITCWTTPPESLPLELLVKGLEPIEPSLVKRSYDLPSFAAALVAARPPPPAPDQNGDSTIVIQRQTI